MKAVQPYGLSDLQGILPPRQIDSHKGEYGHVLVVGGNHGMAGAARLAAEGAARLGAGRVSVATRATHAPFLALDRPEVMVHAVESIESLRPLLKRATVIVIGPGLGQDTWAHALFNTLMQAHQPKVIDADALNLMAAAPLRSDDQNVLTPHPGEAARLLHTKIDRVQNDRCAAIHALRERFGGTWVLKGAGSLILWKYGFFQCTHGHPGMASGGMGDVLSGMIGALLAQGLDSSDAARLGVALHAAAGELAAKLGGGRGLLALDLLPHARRLLNQTCPC
jgi:NAD(P)H-hydrate epimerase